MFELIVNFKKCRYSKCNTCTLIKIKLGETEDPQKRMILQDKRARHLRKQKYESICRYIYKKKHTDTVLKYNLFDTSVGK